MDFFQSKQGILLSKLAISFFSAYIIFVAYYFIDTGLIRGNTAFSQDNPKVAGVSDDNVSQDSYGIGNNQSDTGVASDTLTSGTTDVCNGTPDVALGWGGALSPHACKPSDCDPEKEICGPICYTSAVISCPPPGGTKTIRASCMDAQQWWEFAQGICCIDKSRKIADAYVFSYSDRELCDAICQNGWGKSCELRSGEGPDEGTWWWTCPAGRWVGGGSNNLSPTQPIFIEPTSYNLQMPINP